MTRPAKPIGSRRRERVSGQWVPPAIEHEASWDRLRERIGANPEIAESLRRDALATVDVLQPILGDDWPLRMLGSRRNPLVECFFNGAPHAIASMVRAGQAVVELRDTNGWMKVVGRIPVEGERAIAELMVASRAVKSGLNVALSPKTDRGRAADLLVSNDEARLYVEVFIAEPLPEIALQTEAIEDLIIPRLDTLAWGLALGGHFLRAPKAHEINPLSAQVREFLQRAQHTTGLQRLLAPGLLDLRAARIDDPNYANFVNAAEIGDFRGITFQHSALGRLVAAVRRKSRQLPATGAGLLVITPPSFLGQPPRTDELVSVLGRVLDDLQNVAALTLMWRQFAQPAVEETHHIGEKAILIQEVVQPPLVERLLFIPNGRSPDGVRAVKLAWQAMCLGKT
jgi:hypothetical protein